MDLKSRGFYMIGGNIFSYDLIYTDLISYFLELSAREFNYRIVLSQLKVIIRKRNLYHKYTIYTKSLYF